MITGQVFILMMWLVGGPEQYVSGVVAVYDSSETCELYKDLHLKAGRLKPGMNIACYSYDVIK